MDSCIQNSNFIQSHMITCKKFLSWSVAALVSIGQESHRISWVAVKILRVPPDLITIQHSRSSEKIFWFEPPLQPKAMYTSEFIQVVANSFTSKWALECKIWGKPPVTEPANSRVVWEEDNLTSYCSFDRQSAAGVARPTLSHLTTCPPCHTLPRPTLSHLTTAFSATQLTNNSIGTL